MTEKKYEYYDDGVVFRVADGITERYDGNGVWTETPYNPAAAMDSSSDNYDFGETIKITEKQAMDFIKFEEDLEKRRQETGYYDD
ncbi:MAG: hypothetical protein J6039_05515 [Alphaproteobacteria bacterium]|nr:hypothetical protein [Alphaproteobacteria bacterium]